MSNFQHLKVRPNLKHSTYVLPYLLFLQQCDLSSIGAASHGPAY